MKKDNWCIPKTRSTTQFYGFAIKEELVSTKSSFQQIDIINTYDYGRVILLDNIPQACELDEFIFHEAIVHPALSAHPNPQDILIIGGGGGGTLREVLKHNTVKKAVMVEIDEKLVKVWDQHLPEWDGGAFKDPRTALIFNDGRNFLEETNQRFDCIILDLSDPFKDSPAQNLFTSEFYRLVKSRLRDKNGIVVLQAESAVYGNNEDHFRLLHTLGHIYNAVVPYYVFIPLFETLYGFVLCSDSPLKKKDLISKRVDDTLGKRGVEDLKFYDGETALNAFSTPRYLRERKNGDVKKEITDENPLNAYL